MRIKGLRGGLGLDGKKAKPLEPTESALSKSIEEFLNAHHFYNDRLNAGSVEVIKKVFGKSGPKTYSHWLRLAKKGTPDRFFIFAGRIYFVEVKARDGRLSPDQVIRQDELRRAGAVVINANSFEKFEREFNRLFNSMEVNNGTKRNRQGDQESDRAE